MRRPWVLLVLALVLASCNDSGGGRGGPTAPGPSPSFFAFGADLRAEDGVGILEVTVLLDGRDIGAELSYPTEGEDHVGVSAVELGLEPGAHLVILRFDRLGTSPATIAIVAGGTYVPPDSSEQRILFQENRREEVREGDGVSFEFDI